MHIDWDENTLQFSPCGFSCTSGCRTVLINVPLLVALGGAFSSPFAAAAAAAFIVGLRWRVSWMRTASTDTTGAPTASASEKTPGSAEAASQLVHIDWDEITPQFSPCASSCTSCCKRVLITAPLLVALRGAFSSAAAAAAAFIVGLG